MELTLVKSLHTVVVTPMWSVPDSEYKDLQVPDVLAAGSCFSDALQMLFGPHPSAVHVCSSMFM
jgi:hypothetical protein